MKDESLTLTGWPAVPVFLMVAATQALTALAMALPITWLINHVLSPMALRWVFGTDRLGYLRCVGMFAIWFAATARIKWTMKS
jgi:hypothetical protein